MWFPRCEALCVVTPHTGVCLADAWHVRLWNRADSRRDQLVTDCEMTMAAGEGSTDAENGVKMACRDRFAGDSADGGTGPGGTAAGTGTGDTADDPQAGGLEIYGDSAYGTGEPRRRARHRHQARARPARRARRVHRRRLRRR